MTAGKRGREPRDRPLGAWRHVPAVVLLPGVVTLAVPALILTNGQGPRFGWGLDGALALLPVAAGAALIGAGLAMWLWTVRLFAQIGRGTLAPWDPTRRLVVAGPYQHVRNPMISAVMAVLLGESLLFGSMSLLLWLAIFFGLNHLVFLLREEPGLEKRFGEEYEAYRRNVPRWIPRRTAWAPVA